MFSRAFCYVILATILTEISCTTVRPIVPRSDWGARPPTLREPMQNPVPFVLIHHSYKPAACSDRESCVEAMQWMQDLHQLNNSWNDIGYSFAVGGDGDAYEGRGWSTVGAHSPIFNRKSIGICVIGDWTTELPPENQLQRVHQLIETGVEMGMIKEDYILLGHRQTRKGTDCPGDRLYKEIGSWPHWRDGIWYVKETPTTEETKTIEDGTNIIKRESKIN